MIQFHSLQPQCQPVLLHLVQVVIPVKIPGSPPLAIALIGMPRSDMQLLHVASKLGPLITRTAPEIAAMAPELSGASAKQLRQAHQQQASAAV